MMKMKKITLGAALLALVSTSATAQIIYSHDFSGDGITQLNGATTTTGGGTWSANTIAYTDGTMGSGEGSALLPFAPVLNTQYELSMDLTKSDANGDWVGLGFAKDPLNSAGVDNGGDRLLFLGPAPWMLYREAGGADDVQIFEQGTSPVIADTGLYAAGMNTLSILIDTTGDGSSFTADFSINGTSISGGAQPIGFAVDNLNYVGFTSADDKAGVNTYVDNFQLAQVPEPATLGLVALFGGAMLFIRRHLSI